MRPPSAVGAGLFIREQRDKLYRIYHIGNVHVLSLRAGEKNSFAQAGISVHNMINRHGGTKQGLAVVGGPGPGKRKISQTGRFFRVGVLYLPAVFGKGA